MLNISDEVKNLFLTDSTKKQLVIKVDSPDSKTISDFNYYTGNEYWYGYDSVINAGGFDTLLPLDGFVDTQWLYLGNVVRASMSLLITNITSDPGTLNLRCTVQRQSGNYDYLETTINTADYSTFKKADFYAYDTLNDTDPITKFIRLELHNTTQTQFVGHVEREHYQIELADDSADLPTTFSSLYSKGVDITRYLPVPDITNDNLDFESFSMTESLCSQDNIKFGLCESAHCEFTTVNYNYDLKDRTIRPSIRVQGAPSYEDLMDINWWYDPAHIVPIGQTFHDNKTVNGSWYWTSHYLFYTDISQYDHYFSQAPRVMAGYKIRINSLTSLSGTAPYSFKVGIRYVYADGTEQNRNGSIKHPYTEASDFKFYSVESLYDSADHGKIVQVKRPYFIWYDQNGDELTNGDSFQIDADLKEFMVYMYDDPTYTHYPEYDSSVCYVYYGTINEHLAECYSDPVPLGVFHITDLKLDHQQNLVKQQVTAYDNIVKLEQNAFNWYTTYMFGMSTSDKQGRYDVQYARQIFSTYFNLMQQLGLESRSDYTETLLGTYDYWNDIKPSHMVNKWLIWDTNPGIGRMQYAEFTINDVNTSLMYMVDAVNVNGCSDQEAEGIVPSDYTTKFDPLRRGIATNGGVLVEFYKSDNSLIDGIVVNRRDYFMVYPETSYIKIYVPAYDADENGTPYSRFIDSVSIYEVASAPQLVNGYYRLFYYQYTSEANEAAVLFDANSSMTGRDVIHSVLEVCGCFFRLNRETGKPEFVYCTKGGLYPRNDLYPADNLYPRSGTDSLLPNGRYMSVLQDNYQVLDYGRIQIVRDTDSNEAKSICEWEYKGSDSLNTYLIDDNVFYCNKDLKYEYGSMPYVSELLENMWLNISNMGYVPNITQALGMPWIECGDRVGVLTYMGGFETFIFRRTMKGIQLLIDTFESEGDEYNEAIKDFGYELYN
jgi:hypothetical protein